MLRWKYSLGFSIPEVVRAGGLAVELAMNPGLEARLDEDDLQSGKPFEVPVRIHHANTRPTQRRQ
jgi:hypothetical protein